MRHLLLIEDDAPIRRGLVDALTAGGYRVYEAADGESGRDGAVRAEIDLVLLDLGLPNLDGLDVLQHIRAARPTLPVIVLTARGAEAERVRGLRAGADDYVVKPFSVAEVLARIEAVLRRSPERPSDVRAVRLPSLAVDLDSREVVHDDGTRALLSEREVDLLRYLVCHAGRPLTREELLERVWRISARGLETRTVDVHVGRLRAKLRDEAGRFLRTVRGRGYCWEAHEAEGTR